MSETNQQSTSPFFQNTADALAQNTSEALMLQNLIRHLLGAKNMPDNEWRNSTIGRAVAVGSAFLTANLAPEIFGGNAVNIAQGAAKASSAMSYIDPYGNRVVAPGESLYVSNLVAKAVGKNLSDNYTTYGAGVWDRTQLGYLTEWIGNKNWTSAIEIDINQNPEKQVQTASDKIGEMLSSASESMKLLSEAFGTSNMEELVKIADKLGASSDPETLKDVARKIKDYVKASGLSANEFAEQFAVVASTAASLGLKMSGMQAAQVAASAASAARRESADARAEGRMARFGVQEATEFQMAAIMYGQQTFGDFAAQLAAMKYGNQKLTGKDAEKLKALEQILNDPIATMQEKTAAMEEVYQLAADSGFSGVTANNLYAYVSDQNAYNEAAQAMNRYNAAAAVASGAHALTATMNAQEQNIVQRLVKTPQNSKEWHALLNFLPKRKRAEVEAAAIQIKDANNRISGVTETSQDLSMLYESTAVSSPPGSLFETFMRSAEGKQNYSEIDILRGAGNKMLADEKIFDFKLTKQGVLTASAAEIEQLTKSIGAENLSRILKSAGAGSLEELFNNPQNTSLFLRELQNAGYVQSYEPEGDGGEGSLRIAARKDIHAKIKELLSQEQPGTADEKAGGQTTPAQTSAPGLPQDVMFFVNIFIENMRQMIDGAASRIEAAIARAIQPGAIGASS